MHMSPSHNPNSTVLWLLLIITAILAVSQKIVAQDDESKIASARAGAITGRVVNESGEPVPHATIFIGSPADPMQARSSSTDDNGNFQVSGLDALIYTVSASAATYVPAPRDPDVLPSYYRIGDSVSISLIKGGVITGTVTSSTGEPVVQAGVRAILIRDANGKPPAFGRFVVERSTDDRGVYRIYGLSAGTYIVAAGGRGSYGFSSNAYDTDAPTYAPSSVRDSAMEVNVRAGEETTADIRYRSEQGHTVSGVVNGPLAPNSRANVTLAQIVNGVPLASGFSVQVFNRKGFAFYGVADGEYELIAQSVTSAREIIASEPRHVIVKGGDISGIELVVRELASIKGRLVLETTTAADCKNKRQPLLSETVLVARRSEKNTAKDQLAFPNFFAQSVPDKSGDFALNNLASGQFKLNARFFAKYWYVRSMIREAPGAPLARTGPVNRQADVARNGITLKFGERIAGVTITLAAGAASIRGRVKQPEGESLPARLSLYLVPVEKENGEDVLRFFRTAVQADGRFSVNNLPPGRYWALARSADESDPQSEATLRAVEESDTRLKIRRAAEADKNEVEFKPCQNVIDYQLSFKPTSVKN